MSKSDDKSDFWPKYLPYTPIAMGMIQPEWMYMSHFFEEDETENEAVVSTVPVGGSTSDSVPSPPQPPIQINFRSRKS